MIGFEEQPAGRSKYGPANPHGDEDTRRSPENPRGWDCWERMQSHQGEGCAGAQGGSSTQAVEEYARTYSDPA